MIKFSKEEIDGKEDIQNMSSEKKIIWLVKVWAPDCVLKRQFFISCTDERMRKFKGTDSNRFEVIYLSLKKGSRCVFKIPP